MEPFRADAPADGLFYFTHPAFNEDGSRLLFWYRHARGEGRWESGVFTADPDGSNLHLLARGNSHTVWFDREHVLVWLSRGPQGPHFYLFKDRTNEYQVAGGDVLVENGHALYSPDGKWLLSDLPVNGRNERTLVVANLREQRCHILGRFFAPPEMKDALRCDLHARWNQSGTVVCFDSLHEGSRQMYLVDLRPLVEGRPRRQTRSSADLSG